jgi:hypothetical protein
MAASHVASAWSLSDDDERTGIVPVAGSVLVPSSARGVPASLLRRYHFKILALHIYIYISSCTYVYSQIIAAF